MGQAWDNFWHNFGTKEFIRDWFEDMPLKVYCIAPLLLCSWIWDPSPQSKSHTPPSSCCSARQETPLAGVGKQDAVPRNTTRIPGVEKK